MGAKRLDCRVCNYVCGDILHSVHCDAFIVEEKPYGIHTAWADPGNQGFIFFLRAGNHQRRHRRPGGMGSQRDNVKKRGRIFCAWYL
ncbi:hypothetical protein SDC9_212247 [bioreactor metagenome]|uniref:Uncharacterized protein n=1 Tax=bioreactor metagenome TaxID=1076179 RepID=A0A645JME8_9ZZZZ